MGSFYGAAISGIRTYADYVVQKNERLHALASDRLGDDPLALQRAQMEAETLSAYVTQAKNVAGLILKIIQPVN